MITDHHQHLAEKTLAQCLTSAEHFFDRSFDSPQLMFNQRGNIAGTAHLHKNLIKLNPVLMGDNVEEFCVSVIPHEVAHILVFQLYGRVKPHGREWQGLMKGVFGLEPAVRHKMDVSKTKGKTFPYYCQCGPVELSVRRHNKVLRRQQVYTCRTCDSILRKRVNMSAG